MKTRRSCLFLIFAIFVISVVLFCARSSNTFAHADENFLGSGTESDPYLIENASDLELLATLTNNAVFDDSGKLYSTRHYKLTSDIDLTGKEFTIGDKSSYIALGYVDVTSFLALDTDLHLLWETFRSNFYEKDGENYFVSDDESYSFSSTYYYNIQESDEMIKRAFFGVFDGNGKTISNGSKPLFDSIRNASIKNLKLSGFSVNGNSLLINESVNSQVIGCAVEISQLVGSDNVGALIGKLSYEGGYDLLLAYAQDGHLVSVADNVVSSHLNPTLESEIKLCTSISNEISGESGVGGIVGCCTDNTLVEDCFNSSSITASGSNAGGIVGISSGNINNVMGVFSSQNVVATLNVSSVATDTSTFYYPTDFCIDTISSAQYKSIDLVSEDFVNAKLPNWTLASAVSGKIFYPTPNSLGMHSEEVYSVTVDGELFDYVRKAYPNYIIPLDAHTDGYCYESGEDVFVNGDEITLNGNIEFVTALAKPQINVDYTSSKTYNGFSQAMASANYSHALNTLTATYQWRYSKTGDDFTLKANGNVLSLTNVNESGHYKCLVTISDGNIEKTTESETIFIEIEKKALVAKSYTDIDSGIYDGNEHSIDYLYQYEGLIDGDVITPLVTAQNIVDAGIYQLIFSIDNDNYDVNYQYGIYFVNNADIMAEVNSYDGIFDGKVHNVSIESIVTVNDCPYEITYSANGSEFVEGVSFVEVGYVSVIVKITAPNHNDLVITSSVNISKATVTITLTESEFPLVTKVYDGTYVCNLDLIKSDYLLLNYDSDYEGVSPISVTRANFAKNVAISRTNVVVYFSLNDTKNFILGTQNLILNGCSIMPAEVKIIPKENLPSVQKRYDGNINYPINQLPSDMYAVVTDCPIAPIVNVSEARFNSANVNDASAVRISFTVVSSCYYFADGYSGFDIVGRITPKIVSVSSITAENRVFDNTKNVTISAYELTGIINGDSVKLSYEQALSESENASQTPHLVTASGLRIDNDNYVLDYTTAYTYVTIYKADPIVNPIVEDVTLYLSSTLLPNISLSIGDTEGTIEWADYVINESGEIPYQWNFYSSSANYNDMSGIVILTVNSVVATSISATSYGSNEYFALKTFNSTNLDVLLIYNDGSTSILNRKSDTRDGYVVEYSTENNYLVYGDTFVTIRYGEFSDAIEIVVKKNNVTKPIVYGQYTYNGNEQTLAMSYFDTALVVAEGNKRTTAGTTEVLIKLKDEINYCFEDGSSSFVHLWTINPRSVSQPYLRDANSQYDGMEKEIEVVNPTQKTYYTFSGNTTALNQGEYHIVVSLIDKVNNVWYETNSAEDIVLTYTITSKPINKPLIYNLPYVYNGSIQNANYDISNAYIISGDTTYLNAGEYSISANLLNIYDGEELVHKNYVWEDGTYDTVTLTYQVGKITVNVPNINTRFEYNGKTHRLPLENNFNYSVSGSVAEVNAGTYQAILTLSDDTNFVWADGTTEDKVISYRILKKTIQLPTVLGDSVYSGYEMTALIPQSQYYTLIGNTATAVGEHTAKASLNNKLNYQWSDGTTDDITLTYKIVKRVIDIPDAPESLWYNGFPQVAHIGSDEAYVISGNTATDPGTYTATISLKDKNNYLWKDGTSEDVKYTYCVYSVSFSEESTPALNNSFSANSELYTPVKDGFNFVGWYDNPNYEGERITSITNPKPDLILYAKWELIEYKEPIYMDDGKKGGLGTNAILGLSIAGGALVIALLIIGVGFVLKRR